MVALSDDLEALPGIGPATARLFAEELGIRTVDELVHTWPRGHEDLGDVGALATAEEGESVTMIGTITDWDRRRTGGPGGRRGRRGLEIHEADVRTADGHRFAVVFFNQPWIAREHPVGTRAAFAGKVRLFRGRTQLQSPKVERLEDDDDLTSRLRPLYHATEALPHHRIARAVATALELLPPLAEWVDEVTLARNGLIGHDAAVRTVHLPEDRRELHAALERLKFDELYTLQLGLRWRRARLERDVVGLSNAPLPEGLADSFVAGVPFEPTGAQWTALSEIAADLERPTPMHRLLQGDVGAGKTLVAVWTMLCAVDNGRQAAMMVPTEVLAEQHLRTIELQLTPLTAAGGGPTLALLTSSTPPEEQQRVLAGLVDGSIDLVVGTHALLEDRVVFADLGVVVIDEQHRFGVDQRVAMIAKRATGRPELAGTTVDVLVMTATPIPRSLALTVYGDLEVTVLDELPPGRQPVTTELVAAEDDTDRRSRVVEFVRDRVGLGEQAFWVCPLVNPSDAVLAAAAEELAPALAAELGRSVRVGMVHGQLPSAERDRVMTAFRDRELDVLVATTVIEVGVDVPQATVMVIEDADRFGISQLHQLRGRVGRGAQRAWCVLLTGWHDPHAELSEIARTRLQAVTRHTDGFRLAETDLRIRGAGRIFGTAQSGLPDLRLATVDDLELIAASRLAAALTIDTDPDLTAHPELAAQVRVRYRGLEEFDAIGAG